MRRLHTGLRDLHPGSFAFVMATGIVSIGEARFGHQWLSLLLVVVAMAGFGVLCVLYGARAWLFPAALWADTARPERAFGFLTLVAGSNVLAVRLATAGQLALAQALGMIGVLAWVVLAYGILARLVFSASKPGAAEAVNGSWLIWVVGTESVSVAVSVLGSSLGLSADLMALIAVSLWALGAILYVLLMAIILARLILMPLDPAQATPPYWITMGATAITVVAGAYLLGLPGDLSAVAASRATVEGLTLFLWAFGTWWFPFLVLLTIWRYLNLRAPVYEQTLWSMVFPLGMYSVATDAFGRAAGLPLLPMLARAEAWLALTAWTAVAVWMVISGFSPGWPSSSREGQIRKIARP